MCVHLLDRRPVDGDQAGEGFYDALKAAGLGSLREQDKPIRFHDLRHTFGTLAVRVWPLHDVQAYMGHADIKTTMIYAHRVPKTDAADRFSKFVESQMAVSPPSPELPISEQPESNSEQLSRAQGTHEPRMSVIRHPSGGVETLLQKGEEMGKDAELKSVMQDHRRDPRFLREHIERRTYAVDERAVADAMLRHPLMRLLLATPPRRSA